MKLYNTMGRRIEQFEPIDKPNVKLYTCGPTVYDQLHIGNLRTFVFYDTLKRTLESIGLKVDQVMNITDVGHLTSDADEGEDKLEKGAAREGKTVWQVADHYIELFQNDVAQLNIASPRYARATDYIDSQIEMIKQLMAKGYAYQTEEAIYFDTKKLADYGELTGQRLEDKEVAARAEVHTDSAKKHPQDFAVWFFTVGRYAQHEMHWDSPWGAGFPGWHLECSAIAHELLGEPLDIHAGGVDLIGTHHTNEIAQTKAGLDAKLANYWVHAEHLMVEKQKMSKSAGTFITLDEIKKRGFEPLALRLLFLQSHYRSQMNFTWSSLQAAQNFLLVLRNFASLGYQPVPKGANPYGKDFNQLFERLQNDLDTPGALASLAEIVSAASAGLSQEAIDDHWSFLKRLDQVFGLKLGESEDIDQKQKQLIEQRQTAREAKDWGKSDELRDQLASAGLEIDDTDNGPIWRRTIQT